jgi:hypothetical protein
MLELEGQTLEWRSVDNSNPTMNTPLSGSIDLVGSLDGGQFIVVFEEPGHPGAGSTAFYSNFFNQSVLGIEVAQDALGPVDPTRAYAFRVHGHVFHYVFPFFYYYVDSDDTVRFGPLGRPNIGGSFTEDNSLEPVTRTQAVVRTKGRTIRRKTTVVNTVDTPADRDREADWQTDDESYGAAK